MKHDYVHILRTERRTSSQHKGSQDTYSLKIWLNSDICGGQ